MLNAVKKNWNRYLWSSLVTFLGGFILAVSPIIKDVQLSDLSDGALFGVLLVGLRGGLKILFELFVKKYGV